MLMFDCQYVMYGTNLNVFLILLNILIDTPNGVLFLFQNFLYLIQCRCEDNNLSEMEFISSY